MSPVIPSHSCIQGRVLLSPTVFAPVFPPKGRTVVALHQTALLLFGFLLLAKRSSQWFFLPHFISMGSVAGSWRLRITPAPRCQFQTRSHPFVTWKNQHKCFFKFKYIKYKNHSSSILFNNCFRKTHKNKALKTPYTVFNMTFFNFHVWKHDIVMKHTAAQTFWCFFIS